MRFDVLTIFPGFFETPFQTALLGKASEKGILSLNTIDIRSFTRDKHQQTDDYPFGGGAGMLMKVEPLVRAIEHAKEKSPGAPVVLLSPQGKKFAQQDAMRYAAGSGLTLICGRYEGMDARIAPPLIDEELSVGDFILSGGESAALCIIEAVSRMVPGMVGNEENVTEESLPGRLKYPQYTRPREFRGMEVPEVVLSGDHARIAAWRKEESLKKTLQRRPDLFEKFPPDADELKILKKLGWIPPGR